MSEYTPTTEEVCEIYWQSGYKTTVEQFDRWLAQVKAEAYDEALQGAAPQAESVSKSSYISPSLPAQIRGLYRADLRERSIQTMLDLAGDLIQELIDLKAAQVLPSSGVDEEKRRDI